MSQVIFENSVVQVTSFAGGSCGRCFQITTLGDNGYIQISVHDLEETVKEMLLKFFEGDL